jgi:dihydroxyacetone kinase-like protein
VSKERDRDVSASETVDVQGLIAMLRGFANLVKANQKRLSELDSNGGDGDHGTTMVRAVTQLEGILDEPIERPMKTLLYDVGWAIMGVDGGATGPLFGAFFMGASEAIPEGDRADARGLAGAFKAGLAQVQKQTRAQLGDKTLLDALIPGSLRFQEAVDEGSHLIFAMEQAAQAAECGARATQGMQARFGRAKNIGAQSIGTQDPGATSVSLMFMGFATGLIEANEGRSV